MCLHVTFLKHVFYISGTMLAPKRLKKQIEWFSTTLENHIKDKYSLDSSKPALCF